MLEPLDSVDCNVMAYTDTIDSRKPDIFEEVLR